ncbi:MAG: hypothetical protein WAV06_23050, partial [Terracidiphilus sp.]
MRGFFRTIHAAVILFVYGVALFASGPARALSASIQPADNPVADPKAVVTVGNARFTVLTPQLIRMEWSADGK